MLLLAAAGCVASGFILQKWLLRRAVPEHVLQELLTL